VKKETAKIVIGAPHSFGWVRCPSLDARESQGWDGRTAQRCAYPWRRWRAYAEPAGRRYLSGRKAADSEEKHEPVSDIDTVVVDSLKALDPEWPIREADITASLGELTFSSQKASLTNPAYW
jgi:hypothetical protein